MTHPSGPEAVHDVGSVSINGIAGKWQNRFCFARKCFAASPSADNFR